MKRAKWKSGVSLLMAAAMVMGGMSFAGPVMAADGDTDTPAVGTTYYIDAENGDDSNAGTSENAAWKSFANVEELDLNEGDKVLLKAGCTWNLNAESGAFEVNGAEGTEENPVVIGKYSEGDNPVINGNGNPWQTNTSAPKEDVAAVHITNSKYITIENLEVTNWESDAADLMGESAVYDQSKYLLTGILVENNDAGDLPGVVIQNNYVHDVNGYMQGGASKGSGGIIALVTGGSVESKYTDLTITGNKVEKVCHEAIYMESCWAARTLVGGQNSQDAGKNKWVGWPNVYVADNYVNEVAGDGIVLINADGGIAENNLVTASANEDWNYSRNPAHAAIWMWDCNNVTMQYNEAAYTETTQDGMAFDCDYGNQNVMYQYNYSHDNKGGFWMACPGPYYTVNSVVRYNLSVNDGLFDGSRLIRIGEKGSIGHQVYNNTIYWNTGYEISAIEQASWGTPPTSGTDVYNNIFYGDSSRFANNDGVNYDSNCVWGSVKDVYPVDEDVNAVVADPMLTDVADYTTGTFADGKVTLGTANGLKLTEKSPCINAGRDFMAVPEESFTAVANELVPTHITLENRDYEGNQVPYATGDAKTEYIDIGAFEYQGAGSTEAVSADKTYLQALVDLADSYKAEDFTADSWEEFAKVAESAKAALGRPTVTQAAVDATSAKMEKALANLKKQGDIKVNTAEDDTLAAFNSSDTIDNSGFEKEGSNWGTWQSTVASSTDRAHTGEKSWKVTQTDSTKTAYSEIGNVPVKANTEYVCEAWVYCGDGDITKVGFEAKHHNSVTGSGDLKLKTMQLAADAEKDENGWAKIVMEFTTQGYEKISMSVSSDLPTVYLDDVVLYEKYTVTETVLDKTELNTILDLVPAEKQSYYSNKTWKAYQAALVAAKVESVNAMATQDSINAAATNLQKAYAGLTKQANSIVLDALYAAYAAETQGNYTDESWAAYQAVLKEVKAVVDNKDSLQADVDKALASLRTAHNALALKPAATVTDQQQSAQAAVTNPAKTTVKTLKVKKGKKLTVKWKKIAGVNGYQLQYSTKKSFKSSVKNIYIKKNSASKTLKKLKKGKRYYVRVRAYKTVNVDGKNLNVYGKWSKAKRSGKIK